MSTPPKPSLGTILSEAAHVITSNPTHFSILSLIFLLPISIFSLIVYVLSISAPPPPRQETLPSYLIYLLLLALFVVVWWMCAVPSITYSAYLAYNKRPVSILTSLKAVLRSFFPLLATTIVAQTIISLIALALAGVMFLLCNLLVDSSSKSMVLLLLMTVLLVVLSIYVGINWGLSNAIVVVESKWGFAALRRSSYMAKGMRGMLLKIMILYGAAYSVLTSLTARVAANAGGDFTTWEFLLQMAILAALVTLYSLYGLTVNVVVFEHCKEVHGEIEDVSGSDYVKLGAAGERVTTGVDAA